MSSQAASVAQSGGIVRQDQVAAIAAFGLALFTSAFLLFWVEPLFARMLLPRLGGSQVVWSTCLVFFQTMMLLGYSYAHLLARFVPLRQQVVVQAMVLLAGCAFLPLLINSDWSPSATTSPVFVVLALCVASLGWPFFALSANAPLLQHWFSCRRDSANPYFLYALSNAGSLFALAGYPFLIEPLLPISQQSSVWAYGYFALTLLIAGAGGLIAFTAGPTVTQPVAETAPSQVQWKDRLAWLGYAALPSGLLIGVTGYITTDVGSFPLLWIVPLALYLLTFIIAFSENRPVSHAAIVRLLPVAVMLAAMGFWLGLSSVVAAMAVHLAVFFIVALACHGELARLKPVPDSLTEFYFWLSLGGALGGALTALLSPILFKDIVEYPLALALVCLLRPGTAGTDVQNLLPRWAYAVLPVAILVALVQPLASHGQVLSSVVTGVAITVVVGALFYRRPINSLLLALCVFLVSQFEFSVVMHHGSMIWRDRSPYGAYTVTDDREAGYRIMFHGTTLHGVERLNTSVAPQPLSYYAPQGPLGEVMRAVGGHTQDVAVIGLGVGSTACYAKQGQSWTFYEIDPLVENLARHSGYFRSLPVCAPGATVVLGDGRLNLEKRTGHRYDLLVLDAFTSDAIPVHLLTREAFRIYLNALNSNGVIAVHISNRHFDLAPIIGRIAAELGLTASVRTFVPPPGSDLNLVSPSRWMVLARNPADLGAIAKNANWAPCGASRLTALWTDDFSNVLSAWRTNSAPPSGCSR